LERYHQFYGETLKVECPTGSGRRMNLHEVAQELATRLAGIFLPDAANHCPYEGAVRNGPTNHDSEDYLLFHEYFHAETGCGLGASHQTGWTGLIVDFLEKAANGRQR
jgi:hypothetical protein